MAIFGNGKTTVAKATFAERLSSVKAMFQTAHNQASALNDEMQKEIETKQAQIESINAQIKEILQWSEVCGRVNLCYLLSLLDNIKRFSKGDSNISLISLYHN